MKFLKMDENTMDNFVNLSCCDFFTILIFEDRKSVV